MSLYAKVLLFFIRPALDLYRDQPHAKAPVLGVVGSSTQKQQEDQRRDIRGRLARKPELHR